MSTQPAILNEEHIDYLYDITADSKLLSESVIRYLAVHFSMSVDDATSIAKYWFSLTDSERGELI